MELYEKIHPEGWKDYPDTTTPIEGDNLTHIEEGIYENSVNIKKVNNVTKYITATAGADGDFYIDIENDLATGMVLYISFPTATNPQEDARLSIDGGSNYNFIVINENIKKAESVENDKLELVYDGENWQIILTSENIKRPDNSTVEDGIEKALESKSAITVYRSGSSNQLLTQNETYEKYLLNTVAGTIGNKLTFDADTNEIIIGEGITNVLISSDVTFVASAASNKIFQVRRNGDSSIRIISGYTNNTNVYYRLSGSPFLCTVAPGDRISIYVYGKTNDYIQRSTASFLTIEER